MDSEGKERKWNKKGKEENRRKINLTKMRKVNV